MINKDQIKGKAKDLAGQAQEKIGDATDNTEQRLKGLARQGEGKAQKGVGDVKDAAHEAGKDDEQR